jgi:mono/diheme cytochrome c family protein
VVQRGEELYRDSCRYCHGKEVVARAGGSVPDLRFATEETHAAWNAIVVGGAKRLNGMPGSEMSREDAEAVRQYVLSKTDELRERLRH